jgi:cation diffusion facilitator family transporter
MDASKGEAILTDFLVKCFVKNYSNIDNAKVRTAYGILSSAVGISCNAILSITKIVIGMLINSISVMADGFNNLSDAGSSVISLIGIKLAGRPADKEHPFGHGRFEYISALVVAILIIQVGLELLQSSFKKVLSPETISFNPVLTVILALSVFIKLWLMLFNRKLGRKINSSVMIATSYDSRNDVLITIATIISAIIAGVTGLKLDAYMGLLVSGFVIISGFKIVKETIEPLLGQAVEYEIFEKITKMVEGYEGIVGTHDLIIHNYGPTHRMATIHVEVPNNMNIEKAHEAIEQIERDVLDKLDIFLVIHMDPIEVDDEAVLTKKNMLLQIINSLDSKASIHDFIVVNGEHHINLIFDMVVPYTYTSTQEQLLQTKIEEELKKIDERFQCIITIENSFIADK